MAAEPSNAQIWYSRAYSASRGAREGATKAYLLVTDILWRMYNALFKGLAESVFPDHTRDAFFQLWCDARTNTPKDFKWLKLRLAAFKPHSVAGYLGLAAFILTASAASCSLLCVTLVVLAVSTYCLIGLSILAGLASAFWMLIFSFGFFVIASAFSVLASIAFSGYTSYTVAKAILSFLHKGASSRGYLGRSGAKGGTQKASQAAFEPSNESATTKPSVPNSEPVSFPTGKGRAVHNESIAKSAGFETPSETSNGGQQHSAVAPPDVSPGRLPDNKAGSQLMADEFAEGGPTVKGARAEAVHPSVLSEKFGYTAVQ